MSIFSRTVSVVTGGGSGIGAALARELASRGSRVAIADIRIDTAQALAAEIGKGAGAFQVDVSDAATVEKLAADVTEQMGPANFVLANAGVVVVGGLHETSSLDFEWMFDVNVLGVQRTAKAFLPALLETVGKGGPARIITTGSENSFGLPGSGATTGYTSTKHAILGLSDGLRRDLKDLGIAVSILCPGMVVSNLADARSRRQARFGGAVELPAEQMAGIIQFMRAHGQLPEETALLCCDGIARGDFMIITDPGIRNLVDVRTKEIESALAIIDAHVAGAVPAQT